MLVLSRRPNEKLLFPTLGVTVQVLSIQKGQVRLGIEAPPEIRVRRAELPGIDTPLRTFELALPAHRVRNLLNKVNLALHLLQRQLDRGQLSDAESTLHRALETLENADRALEKPSSTSARRNWRTLVVEDDSNERELLSGLLSMSGCECDSAEDGEAALQWLASHDRPDFILLDMLMPRRDGAQTLKEIRQDPRYRNITIFAISGTSPQQFGIEMGPRGVDAWFAKPLNPRRLWEAMQQRARPSEN
jgi:carbon storage regulator CsrA